MRKQILWIGSGMVLGSLITAPILAGAESFQVAVSNVKLMVNGVDQTPANGTFWNGEANIPVAFTYHDSNYVPLSYLSKALGVPVQWDEANQTIWLGTKPANATPSGSSAYKSYQPDANLPVTFTPTTTALYDRTDMNILKVSVAVRNDGADTFKYGAYQADFVGSDGTKYTGSMYVPQGNEFEVTPKTTRIIDYYATVPKGLNASSFTLNLTKADFTVFPAQFKTWASVALQDTASSAGNYSGKDTPIFNLGPYNVQLSVDFWGYKNSTLAQTYKVNASVTQQQNVNVYPNASDLIFELVDGNEQTIAQQRYAIKTSANANVPVLIDGDQFLTYTVDWGRYNKTGAKVKVWDAFGEGKRLLGTYYADMSNVYPNGGHN